MNIRKRIVGGVFLGTMLLLLAALHVVWALAIPFPASTLEDLGDAVLPLLASTSGLVGDVALPHGGWPSALITPAIAACLMIAAVLVALQVVDLNRARSKRSLLLRLATFGIAALFVLRAIACFVVSLSA